MKEIDSVETMAIMPFRHRYEIVADIYSYDSVHKEMAIYLRDKETNLIIQDIALIRESLSSYGIQCLVYADSEDEDYTDEFKINIYEGE